MTEMRPSWRMAYSRFYYGVQELAEETLTWPEDIITKTEAINSAKAFLDAVEYEIDEIIEAR